MTDVFRLFLVEDDPDDQYLIKMAFDDCSISVETQCFENGKLLYETLSKLESREEWPHLILLDLNLPEWNGKKTLEAIKKHPDFKTIPVVVYTTSRSEHDMEETYLLGANSYIVKPYRYDYLLETIEVVSKYWFDIVRYSKKS